ncbi:MAG: glycosyltransferase, partial [Actinomycetota bacterium]|nr:glycosyltransferase [Actinomycetota bacterium]
MRILHVVNELDNFGDGIVNVTVDLACTQADLGHEVSVVSSGGAFEPLLAAHGVTHHRARFTRTPRVLRSAFRVLGDVVTAERPNVVHAHTMTPVVLLRVLRAVGRWRGTSPQ